MTLTFVEIHLKDPAQKNDSLSDLILTLWLVTAHQEDFQWIKTDTQSYHMATVDLEYSPQVATYVLTK